MTNELREFEQLCEQRSLPIEESIIPPDYKPSWRTHQFIECEEICLKDQAFYYLASGGKNVKYALALWKISECCKKTMRHIKSVEQNSRSSELFSVEQNSHLYEFFPVIGEKIPF